jgi:hypothetical protein
MTPAGYDGSPAVAGKVSSKCQAGRMLNNGGGCGKSAWRERQVRKAAEHGAHWQWSSCWVEWKASGRAWKLIGGRLKGRSAHNRSRA